MENHFYQVLLHTNVEQTIKALACTFKTFVLINIEGVRYDYQGSSEGMAPSIHERTRFMFQQFSHPCLGVAVNTFLEKDMHEVTRRHHIAKKIY